MKKSKILISMVVAVVLVLSLAATAFAATATVVASSSEVKAGDTISFTVSSTDAGLSADVAVSDNLEFVSVDNEMLSFENNLNILGIMGDSDVVYTYRVAADAVAGETISFQLTNVVSANAAGQETAEADASATATVVADEPVVDPDDPTDPSDPVGPTDPSDPTDPSEPEDPADPSNPSDEQPSDDQLDDVPKTGDATTDMWTGAIIALAVAGVIGIVAGKKAFSK